LIVNKRDGVIEALEVFKALGLELLPVGIERSTGAIPESASIQEDAARPANEQDGAILTNNAYEAITDEEIMTKSLALQKVRDEMGDCKRCKLCQGRNNIVFGEGNPAARLMFVGEGPGADEDEQGRPFVGRAGQVLTNLINKLGFERGDFYIANVVKCRPPGNRDPEEDEISACRVFLEKQIDAISPVVIMTLGSVATRMLLSTEETISRMRGRFHDYRGVKVMPTFHPSYLLRSPKQKMKTWDDARAAMRVLGVEVPQ
jgi:DNA polymerase